MTAVAGLGCAAGLVLSGCAGRAPAAPSAPLGDSNGYTDTYYAYTSHPTQPNAGAVALRFTWDDGDTSPWTGTTYAYGVPAVDSHQWSVSGIYHVRAQARGAGDRLSPWSDSLEVTILVPGDEPPLTPGSPLGPDSGLTHSVYAFRTSATDDDNDSLQYQFDWGDGDTSAWLGPIPAGDTLSADHAWLSPGTYDISVQAKDAQGFGSTSGWSLPHSFTVH
jgi:hypothetical protein